jgi:hypothetical protein
MQILSITLVEEPINMFPTFKNRFYCVKKLKLAKQKKNLGKNEKSATTREGRTQSNRLGNRTNQKISQNHGIDVFCGGVSQEMFAGGSGWLGSWSLQINFLSF